MLRAELERAGWAVQLITLECLPLPLRFLPHIVGRALNWLVPPLGFYYKDRLARFLYRRLFDYDASLRIFEDIYLSWNSSVPSVTVLHAVWSDNLQSISAKAPTVDRLVSAEERSIDSITHPIITVSDKYRDFLVKTHSGSRRLPDVAVVPLGLDLNEFDIADHAERSAKSLVFCGSLERRKNLRFLLEVFRHLHKADGNYRLTIIGDGPDLPELERYVSQHALPVTFRGRLRRKDVITELRRHTVYVHPSVKESFSFALLEAKMTGLKTVAHEKLEVPAEFIDVPVESFEIADWHAAVLNADDAVSKKVDPDTYSSRRMMLDTLRLAYGAAESAS